jgi:hypothetical protein
MPSRNAATQEKWTIDNAQWTVSRNLIANCQLSTVNSPFTGVCRVFDALKLPQTPPHPHGWGYCLTAHPRLFGAISKPP